ncbi:hypothetical protein QJS66_16710 [Kocuria rhizophila]|nr:hypothetical protein QJS66_16710 [Kocuria rhizophila]
MTQMALVLLLGHAGEHPARAGAARAARGHAADRAGRLRVRVRGGRGGVPDITWGFGLVVRGCRARGGRRVSRRGTALSRCCGRRLLRHGAGVAHGVLGLGPLTAATPGSFIEKQVGHATPVSETTFSGGT